MTAHATSSVRLASIVALALCAAFLVGSCGAAPARPAPVPPPALRVRTGWSARRLARAPPPPPRPRARPRLRLPSTAPRSSAGSPCRASHMSRSRMARAARSPSAPWPSSTPRPTSWPFARAGQRSRARRCGSGRRAHLRHRPDEPVVWVVDAETHQKVRSIRLPGVTPHRTPAMTATGKYSFAQLLPCSSAVACTPDGALVLVFSTGWPSGHRHRLRRGRADLRELRDGTEVAVSFDGTHAYIATVDSLTAASTPCSSGSRCPSRGWRRSRPAGPRDLGGRQRVKCGEVGGIAVDPDDSRIFCQRLQAEGAAHRRSGHAGRHRRRAPEVGQGHDFQPRGVGVLPDGSKVYVVVRRRFTWSPPQSPRAATSFSAR